MNDLAVKFLLKAMLKPKLFPVAQKLSRLLGLVHLKVSLPQRIGHLALETDCFLRDCILKNGKLPSIVMVEPTHGGFANNVLARYLSKYVNIIPRTQEADVIEKSLHKAGLTVETAPYVVAMYETAKAFDVLRRWGNRPPLFELTEEDRSHTDAFLRKMGVPAGAWFVCLHARGGGFSPADEHWHSHRNVNINDYSEAIQNIVDRGGWCVRMGDPTMEPILPQKNVIDYALSEYKSPRLDIGLVGSCRFFLGCASGLNSVAVMFGRPAALTNVTPLSGSYALGVDDISIPQSLFKSNGERLSVDEIFGGEAASYRKTEEFHDAGLIPKNVSPEEIGELVMELMDRLDNKAQYTPEDDLRQEAFSGFFKPGHYAFGAGSRIGRDYLRRNVKINS